MEETTVRRLRIDIKKKEVMEMETTQKISFYGRGTWWAYGNARFQDGE